MIETNAIRSSKETASSPSSRRADFYVRIIEMKDNQSSNYEEPEASTSLKRKVSTAPHTEAKHKRSTEKQVSEENSLDYVELLKIECMLKDNQIEKLEDKLSKKEEEIERLVVANDRYISGSNCGICDNILLYPYTINCGHSFCYFCLVQGVRENGRKCPLCWAKITIRPVYSYALKDQVETIIEQLPPEERDVILDQCQMYDQMSGHLAGMFNDVLPRSSCCPNCGWEENCNDHNRSNTSDRHSMDYDPSNLSDTSDAWSVASDAWSNE